MEKKKLKVKKIATSDKELAKIVTKRLKSKSKPVKVDLKDL